MFIYGTFQLVLPQTTVTSSKFSGTRKFTLRYLKFEMSFDFEISRADCTEVHYKSVCTI